MQLWNSTEHALLSCPRPKQPETGKTVWAKHHMILGPYDTKTEKKEADCYLPKNGSAFQSQSSQIPSTEEK